VFSPMHVGGVNTVSSGGNLSPTTNINRPSNTSSPPHRHVGK
jgi:hypothetical protein